MPVSRLSPPELNALVSAGRIDHRSRLAEDGEGTIIRLVETEGREAKATLAFPHLKIARASRTNLVEEDGDEIPSSPGSLQVDLKPFGIATVRVKGDWAPR